MTDEENFYNFLNATRRLAESYGLEFLPGRPMKDETDPKVELWSPATITLFKKEPVKDLGIHIRDGVGTQDRLGG